MSLHSRSLQFAPIPFKIYEIQSFIFHHASDKPTSSLKNAEYYLIFTICIHSSFCQVTIRDLFLSFGFDISNWRPLRTDAYGGLRNEFADDSSNRKRSDIIVHSETVLIESGTNCLFWGPPILALTVYVKKTILVSSNSDQTPQHCLMQS